MVSSQEMLPETVRNDDSRTGSATGAGWQKSLAGAIRDPAVLLQRLGLDAGLLDGARRGAQEFPLLVPESYVRRMRPGDQHDPLLRQVLPLGVETETPSSYLRDPLEEADARKAPGMLQKYAGRALLITHGSCAVNCRYCFRRHYDYHAEPKSLDQWAPALQALRDDSTIKEVLLSGGDPLILSDARLAVLMARLEEIPHLTRLRVHTRLPIVLPDRVTPELVSLLKNCRLRVYVVVHSNHAQELVADCAGALRDLLDAGLTVLNQAVLLRGVNDSLESLKALCERCVDLGVLPYYLHQLDRVVGAAHFEVPADDGKRWVESLREILPGYAVPRFVVEEPGAASKTLLM